MAIACLLYCTALHIPRVRSLSAACISSLSSFSTALCRLYMTVFSALHLKIYFHHSHKNCVALNRTTANFNSKIPTCNEQPSVLKIHFQDYLQQEYNSNYVISNSNKSPTRCNNFPVYYPDVYLQLNTFRVFSRPSSGAQ
jgi:hypothetical protein